MPPSRRFRRPRRPLPPRRRAGLVRRLPPGHKPGSIYPVRRDLARRAFRRMEPHPVGPPMGPGLIPGRMWAQRRTLARQAFGALPRYADPDTETETSDTDSE